MRLQKSDDLYGRVIRIHKAIFTDDLDSEIEILPNVEYNSRNIDYCRRLYEQIYLNLVDNDSKRKMSSKDYVNLCINQPVIIYNGSSGFYSVDDDIVVVRAPKESVIIHEIGHRKLRD